MGQEEDGEDEGSEEEGEEEDEHEDEDEDEEKEGDKALSIPAWNPLPGMGGGSPLSLRRAKGRKKRKMRIDLIVTADDMGICEERNQGIVKAMREGVVTQTSVIANGLAAEEGVALLKKYGLIKGRLGLHLNLTEGRPIRFVVRPSRERT